MTTKKDFFVHTNHPLSPKLKIRTLTRKMYPDSIHRYNKAYEMLSEGRNDLNKLLSIFSYHDQNFCICKHGQVQSDFCLETIFTMILELRKMDLYLIFGWPCRDETYHINLHQVFD